MLESKSSALTNLATPLTLLRSQGMLRNSPCDETVHSFGPLRHHAFELALHRGKPTIVYWGIPLLAWGYLQYLLVGRYRLPKAGGSPGMDVPP